MSSSSTPAQQSRELRESLRLARELADALVSQADRVRAQCEKLEEALRTLDSLEATPAAEPQEAEPVAPRDKEQPARLAAMEMVMQGRSREDVLDYLRRTLDEEKAQRVVAGVFDQTRP